MARLGTDLQGTTSAQRSTRERPRAGATAGRRLVLAGGVQGLGVRPAIFRLARAMGLAGTVSNTPGGVAIEVEGPPGALADFEESLPAALPAAARLVQLESAAITPRGRDEFTIVRDSTEGPLATRVPVDLAVCSTCRREIGEPADRRAVYPFTSCTQCGPRYSVVRSMPFERADTSLAAFPLCVDCRHEYERPRNRRFHAQTIACPACGPRVWCQESGARAPRYGSMALDAVVAQLTSGKIVALRGLGGYQLLADATSQAAVERLRLRKGRQEKPLAVMVESVDAAKRLAFLDETEIAAFGDPAGPIVLVRARAGNGLAAAIHPWLDTVGLLRPTTPLHAIVAERCGRPLVCTSGNREGDPLDFEAAAAERRLADLCDLLLHHDREIVRPIDDSVVRVIAGRRVSIRLARGLAPLPLDLPPMPPTIALGGFLKAAAAWSNGSQAVLGPHVGDQQRLPSRERFLAHLDDVQRLYRFGAEQLVYDLHPEYFSTRWAEGQATSRIAVQHHHAHVVAGMLEQGWLDRQVLGVAWDGTGYGTDDTIWGGEFLNCSAATFERVARLRPFRLPGGEAAIREPWRIALAICEQLADPEWVNYIARPSWPDWNVEPARVTSVRQIIDRPQLSPLTSSAGRLIDAAAAIILGIGVADFDGQAAMRLEAAADATASGAYDFPLSAGKLAELDWRPLFAELLADRRCGVEAGVMAMRFHRSLARGIVSVCRRWPKLPVVLTGGVFQNRLLTELVREMHDDTSQPLGWPGVIPPNDGGLAAGQLAVAAARGGFIPCA